MICTDHVDIQWLWGKLKEEELDALSWVLEVVGCEPKEPVTLITRTELGRLFAQFHISTGTHGHTKTVTRIVNKIAGGCGVGVRLLLCLLASTITGESFFTRLETKFDEYCKGNKSTEFCRLNGLAIQHKLLDWSTEIVSLLPEDQVFSQRFDYRRTNAESGESLQRIAGLFALLRLRERLPTINSIATDESEFSAIVSLARCVGPLCAKNVILYLSEADQEFHHPPAPESKNTSSSSSPSAVPASAVGTAQTSGFPKGYVPRFTYGKEGAEGAAILGDGSYRYWASLQGRNPNEQQPSNSPANNFARVLQANESIPFVRREMHRVVAFWNSLVERVCEEESDPLRKQRLTIDPEFVSSLSSIVVQCCMCEGQKLRRTMGSRTCSKKDTQILISKYGRTAFRDSQWSSPMSTWSTSKITYPQNRGVIGYRKISDRIVWKPTQSLDDKDVVWPQHDEDYYTAFDKFRKAFVEKNTAAASSSEHKHGPVSTDLVAKFQESGGTSLALSARDRVRKCRNLAWLRKYLAVGDNGTWKKEDSDNLKDRGKDVLLAGYQASAVFFPRVKAKIVKALKELDVEIPTAPQGRVTERKFIKTHAERNGKGGFVLKSTDKGGVGAVTVHGWLKLNNVSKDSFPIKAAAKDDISTDATNKGATIPVKKSLDKSIPEKTNKDPSGTSSKGKKDRTIATGKRGSSKRGVEKKDRTIATGKRGSGKRGLEKTGNRTITTGKERSVMSGNQGVKISETNKTSSPRVAATKKSLGKKSGAIAKGKGRLSEGKKDKR
jgi:hypothetical protein